MIFKEDEVDLSRELHTHSFDIIRNVFPRILNGQIVCGPCRDAHRDREGGEGGVAILLISSKRF